LSEASLISIRNERDKSIMYIGFYVKHPSFLFDFNGLEFSGQILEKYSNIKFHKNPSSGSPVVPCEKTAAFRNLANAPQNLKN